MSDILPTVVWPSDVDAQKRRLDPDFRATDRAVAACSELGAGQRAAWGDFYRAWSSFRDEETPVFGAANKMGEALAYEARLAAWQATLKSSCALDAPHVTPATFDASWIKWGAIAVAVVGVAYLASPLVLGARSVARRA